jgi:hypothetical protein
MKREIQSPVTYAMWALLFGETVASLFARRWSSVFISALTFALTLLPILIQSWSGVKIPKGFVGAIIAFTVATIYFGEAEDYYNRFWWWDIALHTGSAAGFGMIGSVLVLMLIRGDRLRVSPSLASVFAFAFAVSIGTIWEIFEFAMDGAFGFNMQKSGLVDTMFDLIVNTLGALGGALCGYGYLRSGGNGVFSEMIAEFMKNNRKLFRRRK